MDSHREMTSGFHPDSRDWHTAKLNTQPPPITLDAARETASSPSVVWAVCGLEGAEVEAFGLFADGEVV